MVSGATDVTSMAELYVLVPVPPAVEKVNDVESAKFGIDPSLTSIVTFTLSALSENNDNVSPSTFLNVNDKS